MTGLSAPRDCREEIEKRERGLNYFIQKSMRTQSFVPLCVTSLFTREPREPGPSMEMRSQPSEDKLCHFRIVRVLAAMF